MVHEAIESKGMEEKRLCGFLHHEPYRLIEDFLTKQQQYSALFAQQSSKKVTLFKALFHGLFAFFKSYFIKRGFLQGYKGWIISMHNSHCSLYKYLKLYEKNEYLKKQLPSDQGSEKR
jgi:hypothetical protein